jgi:hypothetical protein
MIADLQRYTVIGEEPLNPAWGDPGSPTLPSGKGPKQTGIAP